MNIVKESIAETRKLKLVRTKLVNGYYFEIFTKQQMNEMQKRLNRLEDLERKERKRK